MPWPTINRLPPLSAAAAGLLADPAPAGAGLADAAGSSLLRRGMSGCGIGFTSAVPRDGAPVVLSPASFSFLRNMPWYPVVLLVRRTWPADPSDSACWQRVEALAPLRGLRSACLLPVWSCCLMKDFRDTSIDSTPSIKSILGSVDILYYVTFGTL
jgi:hypothetical protein